MCLWHWDCIEGKSLQKAPKVDGDEKKKVEKLTSSVLGIILVQMPAPAKLAFL